MRRDRVQRFLPGHQREIEERLASGEYQSFRALAKELKSRGLRITKSSLQRLAARIASGEITPRTADPEAEEQARRDALLGRPAKRPQKQEGRAQRARKP